MPSYYGVASNSWGRPREPRRRHTRCRHAPPTPPAISEEGDALKYGLATLQNVVNIRSTGLPPPTVTPRHVINTPFIRYHIITTIAGRQPTIQKPVLMPNTNSLAAHHERRISSRRYLYQIIRKHYISSYSRMEGIIPSRRYGIYGTPPVSADAIPSPRHADGVKPQNAHRLMPPHAAHDHVVTSHDVLASTTTSPEAAHAREKGRIAIFRGTQPSPPSHAIPSR